MSARAVSRSKFKAALSAHPPGGLGTDDRQDCEICGLVTGASGRLGRALVARLLRDGERPRVLVRRRSPEFESDQRISICYGDLGNPEDVDRATRGVSVVYHAGAAMSGCREDFECGTVWGTRNVIDACLKHSVRRLVHVSTLSVLDHAGHRAGAPVNEASGLEPHPELRGLYTQSKLVAEKMVTDATRQENLPAVILRPGQILGPGAEKVTLSGAFEFAGRWIVMGTGHHLLNLVYIDDLVDAIVLAGVKEEISGRVFHLVDDDVITQREFVTAANPAGFQVLYAPKFGLLAVSALLEVLGWILKRPAPLSRYRVQSLAPISSFDCTAAREILGWKPSVGITEGLRRIFGPKDAGLAVEMNREQVRIPS